MLELWLKLTFRKTEIHSLPLYPPFFLKRKISYFKATDSMVWCLDRSSQSSSMLGPFLSFFLCFDCFTWHMGSQFPDQGQNGDPCIGRQTLNHQTTREVPCLLNKQGLADGMRSIITLLLLSIWDLEMVLFQFLLPYLILCKVSSFCWFVLFSVFLGLSQFSSIEAMFKICK